MLPRIDGYRVLRAIASGTRSHLYLVEDPSGRRLALKAPSESFAEDAVYLDGFLREEWIGKRISHPGVMNVNRPYTTLANAGRDDLPRWVDLALAKATAHSPQSRYEALSELVTDLARPNPELVRRAETAPLLEKNPTLFWKLVSATLAGLLVLSLVLG